MCLREIPPLREVCCRDVTCLSPACHTCNTPGILLGPTCLNVVELWPFFHRLNQDDQTIRLNTLKRSLNSPWNSWRDCLLTSQKRFLVSPPHRVASNCMTKPANPIIHSLSSKYTKIYFNLNKDCPYLSITRY